MRLLFGVASVFGCVAAIASAGTITAFTDASAFSTSAGPTTVQTFGTAAAAIPSGVLSSGGVTYSIPTGAFVLNFDRCDACGFSGAFLDDTSKGDPAGPLTAAFDSPVMAFGFDTSNLFGTDEATLTIDFSSGDPYSTTLDLSSLSPAGFFGFQSDQQDIASVDFGYTNNATFGFMVDNFTYTAETTTPEPSTFWLVAVGAMGIGIFKTRRTKVRQAPSLQAASQAASSVF